MARESERGSTTPLLIFFAVIALLLVVVVVDASVAYLRRQELDTLADGAALRGADLAAQGTDAYTGGLGESDLDLSVGAARAGVAAYLREVGAHGQHPGLRADVRVTDEQVVVVLSAPIELPLQLPGAPVRPTVRATASAVVRPDLVG